MKAGANLVQASLDLEHQEEAEAGALVAYVGWVGAELHYRTRLRLSEPTVY